MFFFTLYYALVDGKDNLRNRVDLSPDLNVTSLKAARDNIGVQEISVAGKDNVRNRALSPDLNVSSFKEAEAVAAFASKMQKKLDKFLQIEDGEVEGIQKFPDCSSTIHTRCNCGGKVCQDFTTCRDFTVKENGVCGEGLLELQREILEKYPKFKEKYTLEQMNFANKLTEERAGELFDKMGELDEHEILYKSFKKHMNLFIFNYEQIGGYLIFRFFNDQNFAPRLVDKYATDKEKVLKSISGILKVLSNEASNVDKLANAIIDVQKGDEKMILLHTENFKDCIETDEKFLGHLKKLYKNLYAFIKSTNTYEDYIKNIQPQIRNSKGGSELINLNEKINKKIK